ncbi:MAG: SDR family oxidoreductase [Rhodospirillaceae bacterium]|jgi:3-oxoacyl-[acyl-carrier protein] reductase
MAKPLTGKSALVTGGTRGIGQATATGLLEAGADVIVTGTKPNGTAPQGCDYQAVDFADPQATKSFADSLSGRSIDILVNNSGINKISPFEEIDPEDFARIQQVNVTAPFLLCQAVIPAMKAKSWGRIVNVSSIWSIIGKPQRSSYAASKSALVGMTTTLAAEVARDGILANCVSPGPIDTELTRNVLGEDGMREIAKDIPMNRLGRAEEVAALIVWLAGSENTYISGQNIAIDGGFTRA